MACYMLLGHGAADQYASVDQLNNAVAQIARAVPPDARFLYFADTPPACADRPCVAFAFALLRRHCPGVRLVRVAADSWDRQPIERAWVLGGDTTTLERVRTLQRMRVPITFAPMRRTFNGDGRTRVPDTATPVELYGAAYAEFMRGRQK